MIQGPGEVLHLIRSGRATTRGELVAETGLSRVTVAQRVDALLAAHIIEGAGDAGATGGRRATRFVFNPRACVVVAALDLTSGHIAVVSSHGVVTGRTEVTVNLADGPESALGVLLQEIDELLGREGLDRDRVAAIGLSLPGPIDPLTHRLVEPPIMPGWGGWPVVETVREWLDVPVFVENDADAMAFGEWSMGAGSAHLPLLLVKASEFIGAGIIINGRIYRGFDGGAGDLGHIPVGGDRLCRCGRRGCLATEASGDAILGRLREQGNEVAAVQSLAAMLEVGDPTVGAEIRRAGEVLGRVLGTVVEVLNPARLVVAGTLASPPLVAAIRSAVYSTSQPRATRNLDIRIGALGMDNALVGLAQVALDDLFSIAAVNRRLEVNG